MLWYRSDLLMGEDRRRRPDVRCSCNVVGVGLGRSIARDGVGSEPVLTVMVKDKAEAEQTALCCPAIRTLMNSRATEVLKVGNVVALPK